MFCMMEGQSVCSVTVGEMTIPLCDDSAVIVGANTIQNDDGAMATVENTIRNDDGAMAIRENTIQNDDGAMSIGEISDGVDVVSGIVQDEALTDDAFQSFMQRLECHQYQGQTEIEFDKNAFYSHPLFPLLTGIFEKCEMAMSIASDGPLLNSFYSDIKAFVHSCVEKPFIIGNCRIDGLVFKAFQMLKLQISETDKLHRISRNYCDQYIVCSEGNARIRDLIRSDSDVTNLPYDGSGSVASPSGNMDSPHPNILSIGDMSMQQATCAKNGNNVSYHHFLEQLNIHHHQTESLFPSNDMSFPDGHCQEGDGIAAAVSSKSSCSEICRVVRTPSLPSINVSPCTTQETEQSFAGIHCDVNFSKTMDNDKDCLVRGGVEVRKKQKGPPIPKYASYIMRTWLFQHAFHPYPTVDEKIQISNQTNLTQRQVASWFSNARRRLLKPMQDKSGPLNPSVQHRVANRMNTYGSYLRS